MRHLNVSVSVCSGDMGKRSNRQTNKCVPGCRPFQDSSPLTPFLNFEFRSSPSNMICPSRRRRSVDRSRPTEYQKSMALGSKRLRDACSRHSALDHSGFFHVSIHPSILVLLHSVLLETRPLNNSILKSWMTQAWFRR